jgi:hypothetical protein
LEKFSVSNASMNRINRTSTGISRPHLAHLSNQTNDVEKYGTYRRSFLKATAAAVISSTIGISFSAPAASNGMTEVVFLKNAMGNNTPLSDLIGGTPIHSNERHESLVDIREIYGRVKTAYGWSVLDTAKLFQVNRKTLYEWLASDFAPKPHKATLHRAVLLDEIASHASSVLASAIGTDAVLSFNGLQIPNLLESDVISVASAKAWIDELALKRASTISKTSLSDRLAAAGMSRRPGSEHADILL